MYSMTQSGDSGRGEMCSEVWSNKGMSVCATSLCLAVLYWLVCYGIGVLYHLHCRVLLYLLVYYWGTLALVTRRTEGDV